MHDKYRRNAYLLYRHIFSSDCTKCMGTCKTTKAIGKATMNCQTHPDREAVAFCVRCRQPLCHDCCDESVGKVSCKDRCAVNILRVERFTTNKQKSAQASKRVIGPAVTTSFGLFMIGFSFYYLFLDHSPASNDMHIIECITSGLGVLFVLVSFFSLFRSDGDSCDVIIQRQNGSCPNHDSHG